MTSRQVEAASRAFIRAFWLDPDATLREIRLVGKGDEAAWTAVADAMEAALKAARSVPAQQPEALVIEDAHDLLMSLVPYKPHRDEFTDADMARTFRRVFGDDEGRRVLWRIMHDAGIYRSSYAPTDGGGLGMAYREGWRNCGMKIMEWLLKGTALELSHGTKIVPPPGEGRLARGRITE